MKSITKYYCEKCEEEFDHDFDCERHEQACGVKHTFCCDKCNKKIEYTPRGSYMDQFDYNINKCWTFTPNHYRAGYGSKLDGCEFQLNLCDDCLVEFIKTFKNQDHIWNSGSNTYYGWDEDEELFEEEYTDFE